MRDKFSPQFNEAPGLDSNQDKAKELEQVIDRRLEELLIRNSELVNEGNNGFIFRLGLENVDSATRQNLETLGIALPKEGERYERAIKILKIYSHGGGRREFELQKRAHQLVQDLPDSERNRYAQIPKPEIYRELKLSDQAKTDLQTNNVRIAGDKVEMIFMEFVQGEDLATSFDRWIIEHAPEDQASLKHVAESHNFRELHSATSHILGFAGAAAKRSPRESVSSIRKVNNENARQVYKFLEKTGYELDPAILEQIRNTLALLRTNGIEHPDPHERNFMISKKSENPQAFIVDFGVKADSMDEAALQFDPVKLLKSLTIPAESRKDLEKTKTREALAEQLKTITSLSSSTEISKRIEELHTIKESSGRTLSEVTRNSTADLIRNQESLQKFMAILLSLVKDQKITEQQAFDILGSAQESTVRRKPRGKIEISNPLAYNTLESYKTFLPDQQKTLIETGTSQKRQGSKQTVRRINRSKPAAAR